MLAQTALSIWLGLKLKLRPYNKMSPRHKNRFFLIHYRKFSPYNPSVKWQSSMGSCEAKSNAFGCLGISLAKFQSYRQKVPALNLPHPQNKNDSSMFSCGAKSNVFGRMGTSLAKCQSSRPSKFYLPPVQTPYNLGTEIFLCNRDEFWNGL